ncbi:unnamed protein product [Urochloa humidicola]
MAARAALRGGRRSGAGAGSHLLLPQIPGIGRRAPLERAAGPLLPQLGAAEGAGGMVRRLFSQESFKTKLTAVKSNTLIQIDGPFKPFNSLDVLLDLQEKVYKMGGEVNLFQKNRRVLYILPMVAAVIGVTFWSVVGDHGSNKKSLEQLKSSIEQTEANVRRVRRSIHKLNSN